MATDFGNNQGGVGALASGTPNNPNQGMRPVGWNKLDPEDRGVLLDAANQLKTPDGNVVGDTPSLASAFAEPRGGMDWVPILLAAGVAGTDATVRVSGGRLEFRGTLTGAFASGQTVASLPAGLVSTGTSWCVVATSTGPASASVNDAGQVVLGAVTGSPTWVSLHGLSAIQPLPTANLLTSDTATLPVLLINTLGQSLPAPSLDAYITGTIAVVGAGGVPSLTERTVELSGHGNSTWSNPQKPMKIKFPAATSFLGMPAERHWRALPNWFDQTKLRNAWAFELARRAAFPWTPRNEFAEVYLNGEYQGLYQIAESVRASSVRLPVTPAKSSDTDLNATGAYLFEINSRMETEGEPGFRTVPSNVPIQLEDPSSPSASQLAYIQNWMNTFDATLMGSGWLDPANGYAKYIDMTTWADWWLVSELMRNQDSAFFASVKLYKTRDTSDVPGRLFMGPLWDSDLSLGNGFETTTLSFRDWANSSSGWHTRGAVWLDRMLRDPAFISVANARWAVLKANLLGQNGVLNWGRTQAVRIAAAAAADARRWGRSGDSAARFEQAMRWLQRRVTWLDERMAVPTIVNLITNPRPVVNLDNFGHWSGNGVATLSLAAGNPLGGNSARQTYSTASTTSSGPYAQTFNTVAGTTYTCTAAVRTSRAMSVQLRTECRNVAGNNIVNGTNGPSVAVAANTLVTLPALQFTPGATSDMSRVLVFSAAGETLAVGDWIELCGVMVISGVYSALAYADPGTSSRWVWDGTAFASTSRGWVS